MKEIPFAIGLFLVAIGAFVLSWRSFRGKGFLLNNAWIFASKQERARMDKRPHQRQSGVVFSLIGAIFLLDGVQMLVSAEWIFYVILALFAITILYAIISSIIITKRAAAASRR